MKKIFSVLITNFILLTVLADKVLAQEEFGINDLGDAGVVLGSKPIQETIAGVVNIFLGFLGILATLLLLYAGYLWMTSRGNSEKVERAKLLIASALIGLVIIVSAYAISRFLLSRLYDVAGPTGPGGGGGPGPGGLPTCNEPVDPNDPLVCSLSRSSGPVGSNLTIFGWHFDTDGENDPDLGRVEINGVVAEIVECAGSPMWYDRRVRVKVPDSLVPGNYEVVLYNDLDNQSIENPRFDFTVAPGTSTVNIDCLVPDEIAGVDLQNIGPQNVQILGDGFTDTQDNVAMTGWVAGAEAPINLNITSWSDLEINADVPVEALASYITVTVGADSDSDYFDITCSADGECASGCCSSNSCMPEDACSGTVVPGANTPVIQSISPEDGEEGTLVTIYGYNFGDIAGTVTFDGVAGQLPSALSAGACVDVWTDDYIIMGIPDLSVANDFSGVVDVVVTQAAGVGGEVSDPYPGFDVNDTVRPGICSLDPLEGQYGAVIDVDGINFAATDDGYFDTVVSYNTNFVSANNINTEVPNVVGNLGVTIRTATDISSNAFPFLALSTIGGGPIITELSPDNGPVESYVTIMGSNFGDNVGLVFFDPDNDATNGNEVQGDFDFPAACGDYWFNDYIIVKVPDSLALGGYNIRVRRSPDNAVSNDFGFTVNNNVLGPQICSVSPDNGPVGNIVTISGENFGSNIGSVIFHNGVPAINIVNWSSNQIFGIEIPVGAQTGLVVAQDDSGNNSNGVAFSVGECANDLQCGVDVCCEGEAGNYCAASCGVILNACEYTWDISTQADPFELYYGYNCTSSTQSPSPWPDQHEGIGSDGFLAPQPSLDAFVDTNISALFTRDVEDADFNTANVEVWQCGNGVNFIDADCTVQISDDDNILDIINHNTNREGFVFNPSVNLQADTWYKVELGTFNAAIGADLWSPNPIDDAWHFKTRDSDLLCEVSSVLVTPQNASANMYPGREKNFSASPVGDNCNICGGDYDWQWSITNDPNPIAASFSGPIVNVNTNQGSTRLLGGPMSTELLGAPDNFITLEAENTSFSITGETHPVILAPVLRVEGHNPVCDDSCINVAVWVDFNTSLLAPLNIDNFAIYQCTDPSCGTLDTSTNYTNNLNTFVVPGDGTYRVELLHNPLPANQNYAVVIDQSVTNIHGYPLGIDYLWNFGVSDINCQITGADIIPDNYTANSSSNIRYRGYALADAGICGVQPIQCENCDFSWDSSIGAVATIDAGGVGAQSVLASPGNTNGVTNISLDIDGGALGSASDMTPLTVDITNNLGMTDLAVDNYWPNCGACTNSIAEVWFNSDLQLGTVNNASVRIFDIDDSNYDPVAVTVIGNRHVVLDHGPFDLGNRYQIEVSDTVLNTAGDNIAGGWTSPEIVIENDGCLADAAWVDPAVATAGANQTLPYRAVTTYDAAACGPVPVDCATCLYNWQNNALGNFNPLTINSANTDFTTLGTVANGQSSPMNLTVSEGANVLPVTPGQLTIDLNVSVGSLDIVERWPDCDGACNNSQVGVRFDRAINEPSLAGRFSIIDLSNANQNITSGYTLTGGGRILVIEHLDLILDHQYRVNIDPGVQNSTLNGSLIAPYTFDFTVGDTACRITSVNVEPVNYTAGANEGISYISQTLSNEVPACGPMPVYCDTCTYAWADTVDLGAFSFPYLPDRSRVLYTTHPEVPAVPGVSDGQTTNVGVTVTDNAPAVPASYQDSGQLTISITPPLVAEVSLINVFPPEGINYCTNIMPYMEFDISNGDLDLNSLKNQAVFYKWNTGQADIGYSITAVELNPGNDILTVFYEPKNLLDTTSLYFFGFDDISQVVAKDGGPITDLVGLSPDAGNLGRYFATGNLHCSVHSTIIYPQQDLFTCVRDDCSDDVSTAAGNQHNYGAVLYDIQDNILSSAGATFDWSTDNASIVLVSATTTAGTSGTADNNGLAHLNVEAYLNIEPANIVNNRNNVEVATCQSPWPSLNTYPWDDATAPDMNFSTYYCEEYGIPNETPLPHINEPHITPSPDPDVIREYITTINYPLALNTEKNFGSLAYYNNGQDSQSFKDKLLAFFKPNRARSQAIPTVDIIAFRVMDNSEHLSVLDWYNKHAPNPQSGEIISVNGYEAMQVGATIYIAASNIEGGSIYTNIYIIAHNVGANATTLEIYNQLVNNFKLNINIATAFDGTCDGQTSLSCSSDFDCPSYCTNPSHDTMFDCVASGASWLGDVCNAPLLKIRKDTKRLSDLVNINNLLLEYGNNHKACSNNSLISCQNNWECPSGGSCVPYYPTLNSGSYLNGSSNSRWPSWQETLATTLGTSLPSDPVNLFNGCADPHHSETCWDENALLFSCPMHSLIYMYNITGVGTGYYLGAEFEYDMTNPAVRFDTGLAGNPISFDINMNDPENIADSYCSNAFINAPGASASPYCGNGILDTNYCTNPFYDNQAACQGAGATWVISEECDSEFWRLACSQSPPTANPAIPTVAPAGVDWWNEQTIGCNPPGAISGGNLVECTWYRPNPPIQAAQCGGYCGNGTLEPYYETCDGAVPANSDYNCADPTENPYCGDGCQVVCDDAISGQAYPAALCGDGRWTEGAEQCDPTATPNGNSGWDCTLGGSIGCSNSCERTCSVGAPYLGICGDGNDGPIEEICDYGNYTSPLPQDSSDTYSYSCTLSCEMNGTYCGDGVVQYAYQELCDYGGTAYSSPDPLFSDEFNQYGCRDATTYTCSIDKLPCVNDGDCDQSGDPQICTNTYLALNGVNYGACTATLDGWCGDGNIQNGTVFPDYGELCDPGSTWDGIAQSCPPGECLGTNSSNQYLCDVDCVGTIGGWCGDGAAQDDINIATGLPYEICDGPDYPGRPTPEESGPNNTYSCANDCSGSAVGGGYCGDGIKNDSYYEACDWGPEGAQDPSNYPWPRGNNLSHFSSQMDQYVCSDCVNFGGYCGNGIVDGYCTANCTDWRCSIASINNESDCLDNSGVWAPDSPVGCTKYQCESNGGDFYAYEQCDNGFDPAYLVNKNVDIVYIMDTSGSMESHAANLCASTASVVTTLNNNHPDISYRITIYPLGDGDPDDGGSRITTTKTDDIQQFFKDENNWQNPHALGNDFAYDRVFNALYSDCLAAEGGLLVDTNTSETIDPVGPGDNQGVRYLSYYDDATNDINGSNINFDKIAGDGVNEFCAAYDATENWGYAMKRIIEDYNWLDGYHRIVVPVSDEYAVCGSSGGLRANEDADDSDGVYDILAEAIKSATIDPSNPVFINPVLLSGQVDIGNRLADATGGQFTNSSVGWEVQTLTVINSTICDGVGGGPLGDEPDGHMDCVLDAGWTPVEPPAVPPCRTENQSCAFIACCGGSGLSCNAADICEGPPEPFPVINSSLSVSGQLNQPFFYAITAANNPFSFNATNLPAGLSVDQENGWIIGTPTVQGTFSSTITATNASGSDSETLTITIGQLPVITSALAVTGVVNQPFNYTITANNTPTSFSFNDTNGLGLSIAGALISGTISTSGVYNITITATNAIGSDTETLVITVLDPIPIITSPTTGTVNVGVPYSYTITASGGPTSYNATNLAPGLSVNTTTGVISGTVNTAGVYTINISATNGGGTGNGTLTLTVASTAPTITSPLAASVNTGVPFNYTIVATNSPTSYNATNLAPGLSINTTTGVISGTVNTANVYNINLSATNALGTGTATLVLNVTLGPPVITSSLAANGRQNSYFAYLIQASGSPTSFNALGLPAGLSVNPTNGVISGTPTVQGTFNVTISATNAVGTGNATLVITLGPPCRLETQSCSASAPCCSGLSCSGGACVRVPIGAT